MTPTETLNRLLAEWGPDRWRFRSEYGWFSAERFWTDDISKAGLFLPTDSVGSFAGTWHPVDPATNPLDALIARLKWAELPSEWQGILRSIERNAMVIWFQFYEMEDAGLVRRDPGYPNDEEWQLTTLGQWLLEAGRL